MHNGKWSVVVLSKSEEALKWENPINKFLVHIIYHFGDNKTLL